MKVKICGLSREIDIDYVNSVKPDYIGFVFASSKRQVSIEQAMILKKRLNHDILAVGVFVDDDICRIKEIFNLGIIDIVQLHGHEDELYISKLKEVISCPIIKAIKINSQDDLDISYDVDYYLLDNKVSGSGVSFDWSLIKKLDHPTFLAGGINLNNINDAISVCDYGVDISSGVESNGFKDFDKIREVVRRVRDGKR